MEPNKFKKSVTSAETIDHIKAEGYEQELRSLLTKIFEKEKDSRHSIKIKDGIKYTFEKISSEIWNKQSIEANKPKSHSRIMSAVSSKNQIMKNSNKSKLSETSSSSNLRKSPNLFIRSDQELASFSEFSSPSSNGTFNKAKRASFEGKSQGPGPAAYRVNDDMLKSHSPKAVMPRETKRFDFVSNNETPGPNQYYPSKRALSRY